MVPIILDVIVGLTPHEIHYFMNTCLIGSLTNDHLLLMNVIKVIRSKCFKMKSMIATKS